MASLPVLTILANAASDHGLRSNDYDQYHKYLTNRIARLRGHLGIKSFVQQKNKPRKMKETDKAQRYKDDITAEDVSKDVRFLELSFLLAERANSRLSSFAVTKPSPSYRLSRTSATAKYAHKFLDLAKATADAETISAATFYAALIDGALMEEKGDWAAAAEAYTKARTLIGQTSAAADAPAAPADSGVVASYRRTRTREIEAHIRLAYTRLRQSPETIAATLRALGAADAAPSQRYAWRGREIEGLPEDVEVALAVGAAAMGDAAATATAGGASAAGTATTAAALAKRVAALADAATALRRRVTSAGGSAHDARAALALVQYEGAKAAAALAKVRYEDARDAGAAAADAAPLAMALAEACKAVVAVPGVEDDPTIGPPANVAAAETVVAAHLLRGRAFADGGMYTHAAAEVAVAGHLLDASAKLPTESVAAAVPGGDAKGWIEKLRAEVAGATAYVAARRVLADDAEPAVESVLALSDVVAADAVAVSAAVPHVAIYGWPPRLLPLQVKPVVFDVAHALTQEEAVAAAEEAAEEAAAAAAAPAEGAKTDEKEEVRFVFMFPTCQLIYITLQSHFRRRVGVFSGGVRRTRLKGYCKSNFENVSPSAQPCKTF